MASREALIDEVQTLRNELERLRDELEQEKERLRQRDVNWQVETGRLREELDSATAEIGAVREVLAGDPHFSRLPVAQEVDALKSELEAVEERAMKREESLQRVRHERERLREALRGIRSDVRVARGHGDTDKCLDAIDKTARAALNPERRHPMAGMEKVESPERGEHTPEAEYGFHAPGMPGPERGE